jgi:CDP-diacylglycerol--glycerol-3-phosphate 3-phosphatidyltransferase
MVGRAIGSGFAAARDALARGLVGLGVAPNVLTLVGAVVTTAAAVCYALGAGGQFAWTLAAGNVPSAWLLLAGGLLVLASACDMLDGAVARIGDSKSPFGAFLDSTLDRYSDFAVYAGIAIFYAWSGPAGNVTFILLSMLAMFNAVMISYTKARAEDIIESCNVGFWQRGERSAAILIATFAHNMPALLVQQAILPIFTVCRRIAHTRRAIREKEAGVKPQAKGFSAGLCIWRQPRGTLGYELTVAVNIAWLIFAPVRDADVLRNWLGL